MTEKTVKMISLSMVLMIMLFVIAASVLYFSKKPSDTILLVEKYAVEARLAATEARLAVTEAKLASIGFSKEIENLQKQVKLLSEQVAKEKNLP